MKKISGIGCEYGTEWIVQHILETEFTRVDTEAAFEDSIRECYPEVTQVGWMTFDAVTLMKSQDPISWKIACGEWESMEEDEGNLLSFDNWATYYYAHINLINSLLPSSNRLTEAKKYKMDIRVHFVTCSAKSFRIKFSSLLFFAIFFKSQRQIKLSEANIINHAVIMT